MDDTELRSLGQIEAFLAGSEAMRFSGQRRDGVYKWTEQTLVHHRYTALSRPEKGLLRRYLAQMTGLSRAQITRLITGYTDSGRVRAAVYERTKFATRYTSQDVQLLAYVDKGHGNLSGRLPEGYWSASTANTVRARTSDWRAFPWRSSTGFATRRHIARRTPATNRRVPP